MQVVPYGGAVDELVRDVVDVDPISNVSGSEQGVETLQLNGRRLAQSRPRVSPDGTWR